MWILIISLILLGIIALIAGYIRNKRLQQKIERGELDRMPEVKEVDAECCGQHEVCERDSLLAAVEVIKIGVVSCRNIRDLGIDDIIANGKIGRSVFAYGVGLLMQDIVRQIVPADLDHLNHVIGDLFAGTNRLGDPDDLDLLGHRPVEERSQAEADEDGKQDTKHTDHGAVSQKAHTGNNLL